MRFRFSLAALLAAGLALLVWDWTRPPVLQVPGDFPSLSAALEAAPPGSIIRLAPGRYSETVVIDKPVTVRGPELGRAEIVGTPSSAVVTVADTGRVTLQQLFVTGGRVGVLVRNAERIAIVDSQIVGNRFRGVWVMSGSARVADNLVQVTDPDYGKGIHVANSMTRPRSFVEGNLVTGSAQGIVTNFARATVRSNTVVGSSLEGIAISEMSGALVQGNKVEGSGRSGILVLDMSAADLERNVIMGGEGDGVLFEFHSHGRLLENRIESTGCPVVTGLGSAVLERGNHIAGAACSPPMPMAVGPDPLAGRGLQVIGATAIVLLGLPFLAGRAWPVAMLLMAVIVQGFHEVEHVAQVIQAKVLGWQQAHGLAGAVLDTEWVHFGFNSVLTLTLLAMLAGAGSRWRRRSQTGWAILVGATVFQGYHQVEHIVKVVQHVSLGLSPAPGLLGRAFDLVWMHFWINTVVVAAVIIAVICLRVVPDLRAGRLGFPTRGHSQEPLAAR